MGILVIILLYSLVGMVVFGYLKKFNAVPELRLKIIFFIALLILTDFVVGIFIHRESIGLYGIHLVVAYLLSASVLGAGYLHSLTVSVIYLFARFLVIMLWAQIFNIKL